MLAEAMAAISSAKAALDLAKTMTSVAGELGKVDLKLKAAELTQKITELTQQVTELALVNSDLQQQIIEGKQAFTKLEDRLKVRDELICNGLDYSRKKSDGTIDGPFCTRCYDVDGILVRLPGDNSFGQMKCPQCHILKFKGVTK